MGLIASTPLRCLFYKGGVLKFMESLQIVLIAVAAVVFFAIGFAIGMAYRKRVSEREIGSAETEATRIINEAIRSGESRKKEMLLEAK